MGKRTLFYKTWGLLGLALLMTVSGCGFFSKPQHDAETVVRGQVIFQQYCVRCHGFQGKGDGPEAERLSIRPADLTRGVPKLHFNEDMSMTIKLHRTPQEMMANTIIQGNDPMPSWRSYLTDDQIQDLLYYIRYLADTQ